MGHQLLDLLDEILFEIMQYLDPEPVAMQYFRRDDRTFLRLFSDKTFKP